MKKITKTKGAAMVEFALILPLFLVVVFGIIEFGIMLYDQALITNASREAARTSVAFRNPPLSTSTTPSTLQTQAADTACTYLGGSSNASGTACTTNTLLVSFLSSTASVNTVSTTVGSLVSGSSKVTTTVIYRYNMLVFGNLLALLTPGSSSSLSYSDLSATSSMLAE